MSTSTTQTAAAVDTAAPAPPEAPPILSPALRPHRLADLIGQAWIKESLGILLESANQRATVVDHVLFYGPPGTGKTTLATIIAAEMTAPLRIIAAPTLEKTGDLAAILTSLDPRTVLFIDEIHRLRREIEEVLYPAMEDRALDIVIGSGPGARTVRLPLPLFTLVGATTRLALLSAPLQTRFGVTYRLELYEPELLAQIVLTAAPKIGCVLDEAAALEIARRARGTPRIALNLLHRVRDYSLVREGGSPTLAGVGAALDLLRLDALGLNLLDRAYLTTAIEKYAGGPVGLNTLAAALNEDETTLEEVVEPYLLRLGFVDRTARGRRILPAAYAHLGMPPN